MNNLTTPQQCLPAEPERAGWVSAHRLNPAPRAAARQSAACVGILAGWLAIQVCARAATPTVTPQHPSYFPGEPIQISFKGGPGNRKDWVGVYPEGVVPGAQGSTLWNYVDNSRAGNTGLGEGFVSFNSGLNLAGTWMAFLLLNDGYTVLAQASFAVIEPGTPLVRVGSPVYAPGAAISVTFTNGPGAPKDWIGLYKAGQTPGQVNSTDYLYVDGTLGGVTGRTDGTVTFGAGLKATGDYVAFLLANDGYTVLSSVSFSVQEPVSDVPRLLSISPSNDSSNGAPSIEITARITNGVTKVVLSSVTLEVDGAPVTPVAAQVAELVTVGYTNAGLWAAGSVHTYRLTFKDNGTPSTTVAVDGRFHVASYRSIVLPAPLYFENFDGVAEGKLPAGWTERTYSEVTNEELDFGNLDSATYKTWTVVALERFKGSFVTYSNPAAVETDYQRVLTPNPINVVNGRVLKAPLGSGNILFGNSGYRVGRSQYLVTTTPDYDLTGKSDIHVGFVSLWEQNQDSIAVAEFSTDQGKNWLPVAYFLDRDDLVFATNEVTSAVSLDAVATLTTERGDIARYTDESGEEKGGTYAAFLGAPIGPGLAPFIQGRIDNDPSESKRVELFRLPQADGQKTVRFRLAHAGTDSWYWGIDDFGIYSIESVPVQARLSVSAAGKTVVLTWGAVPAGAILETASAVAGASWSAVAGVTGTSLTVTPSAAQAFYRLRVP